MSVTPIKEKGSAATAPVKKSINEWTNEDKDCPLDLVINAGTAPVILGAVAQTEMRGDAQRIDVGDRRQGAYYVQQVARGVGIALVKSVPKKRLLELEKIRAIRTGDRAADWILEAREKAKDGKGPSVLEDRQTAMTELQRAASGQRPD